MSAEQDIFIHKLGVAIRGTYNLLERVQQYVDARSEISQEIARLKVELTVLDAELSPRLYTVTLLDENLEWHGPYDIKARDVNGAIREAGLACNYDTDTKTYYASVTPGHHAGVTVVQ